MDKLIILSFSIFMLFQCVTVSSIPAPTMPTPAAGHNSSEPLFEEEVKLKMTRAYFGGFIAEIHVEDPGNSTHYVMDWELEITFPRQVFSVDIIGCSVEVDAKKKVDFEGRRLGSTYKLSPGPEGGFIPVGQDFYVKFVAKTWKKVRGFKRKEGVEAVFRVWEYQEMTTLSASPTPEPEPTPPAGPPMPSP